MLQVTIGLIAGQRRHDAQQDLMRHPRELRGAVHDDDVGGRGIRRGTRRQRDLASVEIDVVEGDALVRRRCRAGALHENLRALVGQQQPGQAARKQVATLDHADAGERRCAGPDLAVALGHLRWGR